MELLLTGPTNAGGSQNVFTESKKKESTLEKARRYTPTIESVMNNATPKYFDAETLQYGEIFRKGQALPVFDSPPAATLPNWDDADFTGVSLSTPIDLESASAHVSAHCRSLKQHPQNKYGLYQGGKQHSPQHPSDSIQRNTATGL